MTERNCNCISSHECILSAIQWAISHNPVDYSRTSKFYESAKRIILDTGLYQIQDNIRVHRSVGRTFENNISCTWTKNKKPTKT